MRVEAFSSAEAARVTPRVRVVIVTLDNHLAGAAERAGVALAASGIDLDFHAAADFANGGAALDRVHADIARGDIVISTMLFLEDHIKCVAGALEARRESCDAMLGLMSAAEIVRLTRMGAYRMDKPATGLMAQIKKLRGSGKPGASAGEKQMKMLRRLPKLLKFIPGAAQDVRAYFLTLQYWLAGSDDNVVQMVRALVDRYAAGPRAALKGATRAAAPQDYPEVGVYHPALPARMSEDLGALPAPQAPVATVGLLLLRSYVLGKDAAHYDGVIAAFEARGVRVIPAFASGLDARPAIKKFFMADGRPTIDALVSLTGFSLVGGPAYNDSAAAEEILGRLDVPYLAAHPLEFQTLQQWGASRQGLLPIESTIMVALPELDGATGPHVFGGRADGSDTVCAGCARHCAFPTGGLVREMRSCPERAEAIAAKVLRLAKLRRTERAARKIAIVLFNFPPNAGATGSAAFLGVFESLFNTLGALAKAGYAVDLPASVDDLRDAIIKGNAERFGADANVHARVAADDIVAREPHLAAIEAAWGPAPGRQQSDGRSVFILGAEFGNVIVGIQPAFGYEGDPMKLLFEGQFTPTHAFSTFYRWLRDDYAAHAVLHFGTHGALEFMPGKQAGLTAECWPERLIGDLPNIYLYAANNPSEGAIAKRRSGATLVSYMTPPVGTAGLYKGLLDLKASIERWRATEPEDDATRDLLAPVIAAQAEAMDLDGSDVAGLARRLYEIEATMIPHGLHVVGRALSLAERNEMLDAMPVMETAERARLDALMAHEYELPALIHALDGGYVRPVAGGDVLRSPEIMPTGRNVHGFDPFRLPSNFAVADGSAQAQRLIARHVEDSGRIPESVAMVLWGTDNLKSEGAQIAQALALMGARPRFDSYGRLAGAELVSLAELGRPRIDVVATLSGIFRDLLPLQTRMLAEAAWLASEADEPEHLNFVRKHSLAHMAAHGCDLETASLRVYSNAEGAYGANVNLMIDSGVWTDPDELAAAYEAKKGFAYGRTGAPVRHAALLASSLASVDLAYQNLESLELGITTVDQYVDTLGGISRAVAKAKGGAPPPVYIGDQTQGAGKVRSLGEQVALETRTRMLNPGWYEPMLGHGFEGVRNIEAQVTATLGWSATTGQVDPWVYQRISETYVLDDAMRARISALNPKASARVASRLLEACERDLWRPDAATLAALHAAHDDLEDRLEGVTAMAA